MAGKKHFDFFELFRQEKGRFITRVDHIDDFTTIKGLAARGSLDSDAAWLLERTITSNGVIVEVEYANDAQFTEVWNDRLLSFGPPATGSGAAPGDTNYAIPPTRIFNSDGSIFTPSGGGSSVLYTSVAINNTGWTAIPVTPGTNRLSLNIQNNTGQEVKVSHLNVGGYAGMTIPDQGERIYTIFPKTTANATHIVYARSIASAVSLDVEEILQ